MAAGGGAGATSVLALLQVSVRSAGGGGGGASVSCFVGEVDLAEVLVVQDHVQAVPGEVEVGVKGGKRWG